MKKFFEILKSKVIFFYLLSVLAVPVFTTLTACGDEITGPKVEEDQVDKGKGGEDESD
jgi:hypothetical protein